ncbi:MAG: alpha/beta hydrolase [Lactobacillales bacterium]|nr:alpha/beta hydrolase [Lactobacillales bacterium]
MKKIYDKISLKSRIINFLFNFTNSKKIYTDEKETIKYIESIAKINEEYNLPEKMGMTLEKINDMKVYSYNGTLENNKGKILIYIHGGSYVEQAIDYQIKFAMKIATKTNSTLLMPIYPLAPKGNCKSMYKVIDELYEKVTNSTKNINLLGDSAGGGFILSYAMYLRNKNGVQPKNIVMLSPWLDISMENPELIESEKKDPMSGIEGNRYTGKLWADGLDVKNFLVSPMYGEFENLGILTIITGEIDILKPDCIKLSQKLDKCKIEHNYIEYKGQGHDFGAYPTKEGNMVINDIANIINGDINE